MAATHLLAGLGTGQHELSALQELSERWAAAGAVGAPDGADGAVGDGPLRREGGGQIPEVVGEVGGAGGGGEERADGIGGGDNESRRSGAG